jgi:hypothetical protein
LVQNFSEIGFKVVGALHHFAVFAVYGLSIGTQLAHVAALNLVKYFLDFVLQAMFDDGAA